MSMSTDGDVRFSDFEFDPRTGELRRGGVRVPLQEQPVQVLAILLRNAGQLVTRDELRSAIWSQDTFVDFDDGLNTAIRKLRRALGDSADEPQFVETLPKRGYRFLAPVERALPSTVPPLLVPAATTPVDPPTPSAHRAGRRRVRVAGASVALLLMLASVIYTIHTRGREAASSEAPRIRSLGVLPLRNLSGDASDDYFADGMTDQLITRLANVRTLRVISHASMMRFRDRKTPPSEIARELGVDALVDGSVTRAGNRVRVAAQLIYAPADQHLWADSYESAIEDVLDLQARVAVDIAEQISGTLSADRRATERSTRAPVPAAYDAYLRGRYFWNKFTPDGWRTSATHFAEASRLDPEFALAYVGYADSQMLLSAYGSAMPNSAMPLAMSALSKALALDDASGEAHYSLAFAKTFYEYDFEGAEQEFRRGFELNPSYALGRQWYSVYLSLRGRFEEGIREQRRALELDPLSLTINTNLCRAFIFARRYEEALAQCIRTLELDPNFPLAEMWLRWILIRGKVSVTALQNQLRLSGTPEAVIAALRRANDATGVTLLRARVDALHADSRRRYVPAIEFANAYGALGEEDAALRWLERAYENREAPVALILVSPSWDDIRDLPAFRSLVARVGVVQKTN